MSQSGAGITLDKRFFGFHAHELFTSADAFNAGFGAIRLWDTRTSWRDVEPEPGHYDFSRLDAFVRIAGNNDLKVTLTLGSTPQWASMRKSEPCAYGTGCAAPPVDIDTWKNYVGAVARRYKGRIECYETWNEVSFPDEPALLFRLGGGDPAFYSGSIAQLVALQKVAYEQIKAIDPGACVLSPSFHSTGDWVRKAELFLQAGGGRYFDALSFHFYFGDWPERVVPIMQRLRAALDRNGLTHRRIYNTEVGIGFVQSAAKLRHQSTLSEDGRAETDNLDAALILRTYLINAAFGVDRVYWYAWDDGVFGMAKPDAYSHAGAKPAFAQAMSLLKGQTVDGCGKEGGDRYWVCRLHSASGSTLIYWSVSPFVRTPVVLPAQAKAAYLFGRDAGSQAPSGRRMVGIEPLVVRL